MKKRKYYEAYEDRYRQVHGENLQWASDEPSPIVRETMERYGIGYDRKILEIGCGEGRDANHLLGRGFRVTATDISPEAISYCCQKNPEYQEHFRVLDCIGQRLEEKFDFIYAVAVVHMLVEDDDRAAFYRFIREQLTDDGVGLICTMGDGKMEISSDIGTAFDLQPRQHTQSGRKLLLAGTSCRMVNFETFLTELKQNGLQICEHGLTSVKPDFSFMMYGIVKKG